MDPNFFNGLINAVLDPNDSIRKAAEEQYNKIADRDKLNLLLQVMTNAQASEQLKLTSAVLFRRLMAPSNMGDALCKPANSSLRRAARDALLTALDSVCASRVLRKSYCEAIGEIAVIVPEGDDQPEHWNELQHRLLTYLSQADAGPRLTALHLLVCCPTLFDVEASAESTSGGSRRRSGAVQAARRAQMQQIKRALSTCLEPASGTEVRIGAVKACVSLLLANQEHKAFLQSASRDWLAPCLTIAFEEVNSGAGGEAEVLLKYLVDLAGMLPVLFKPHLTQLWATGLALASNVHASDALRKLAVELLVSLCEGKLSATIRKQSELLQQLVPVLLALVAEIEDDLDEWCAAIGSKSAERESDKVPQRAGLEHKQSRWKRAATTNGNASKEDAESHEAAIESDDEEDDDEMNSVYKCAEMALDRVATSIGGRYVAPLVLERIGQHISSANWRERYAALISLSAIGEGCKKQLDDKLENMVNSILPYLADQDPRVAYAACQCIGQMATDMHGPFQSKFFEPVMLRLVGVLECSQSGAAQVPLRVLMHAAAAMVNVTELDADEVPREQLDTHLPRFMHALEQLIGSSLPKVNDRAHRALLEQLMTTLASLAECAGQSFKPYYPTVLSFLKNVVTETLTRGKEMRVLRRRAIECLSILCSIVPRSQVLAEVDTVIQLLVAAQALPDKSDRDVAYLSSAWGRMFGAMGERLASYLPIAAEPVLVAAAVQPETMLLDDDDAKQLDDDQDWEFVNLGGKTFGIHTAAMEDKCSALRTLALYSRTLRLAYAPLLERTLELMLPSLSYLLYNDIRETAADSLAPLLHVSRSPTLGAGGLQAVWSQIRTALYRSMLQEIEADILAQQFTAFAECIAELLDLDYMVARGDENADGHILSADDYTQLNLVFNKGFKTLAELNKELAEKEQQDGEEDSDEDEDSSDARSELLGNMNELMHIIFLMDTTNASHLFQLQLNNICSLLRARKGQHFSELQFGICMMDDVLEFGARVPQWTAGLFAESGGLLPLHRLRDGLVHREPAVRQAAAYGIALLASTASAMQSPTLVQFVIETVPRLVTMVEAHDARSEDNVYATENAISAVGRILLYFYLNPLPINVPGDPTSVGVSGIPAPRTALVRATNDARLVQVLAACTPSPDQLLARWLSWLPTWADDEEVDHVYGLLCALVETGNSTALGANGHENLPVLIAIFAEAIRREAINVSEIDDDDLLDLSSPTSPSTALVHPDRTVRLASVAVQSALAFRVLGIFTHIQQADAALFERIIGQLNADQRAALDAFHTRVNRIRNLLGTV